jgi:hypothetical protein
VTNGGGEWLLWPDDGCIGGWNDDIIDESVTGGKMTPTARMITTIVDIVVGGWLTIGSWDTSTPMWRMSELVAFEETLHRLSPTRMSDWPF